MKNANGFKLWYPRPAEGWTQGLPIGNGRLGAVIHGGIESEIWSLTETTYWSGKAERTVSRSGGEADLRRMREHFYAGDYRNGEALVEQLLQPVKGNFGTNLPVCDLKFDFGHGGEDIIRMLDLEEAAVHISYRSGADQFTREAFVSHADGVAASRLWSGQKGGISFTLAIEGRTENFKVWHPDRDTLAFSGKATESLHSDGTCGVSCRGIVKLAVQGGTVTAGNDTIVVKHADEVWVCVAVDTDYERDGAGWAEECVRRVEQAAAKGYVRLKEDHVADYRRLYARISVDLGSSPRSSLPTDERIRLLEENPEGDPQLFALFFQYGRYLMISGSREDSPLPMHLQGIWNDGEANRMAWSCDYHLDVNTQMNYYPAEAANLAECHVPLMRFVGKLSEAGRSTARDFYGCEGWTAHVFTNAWGFTAPGWHYSWGLNVTGGLWLAAQLREHYEFGLDKGFLAEQAYPVLKEAAAFFLDYMDEHPEFGWLVTGPSNSPENSFYPGSREEGTRTLSMGPTMDMVLVKDLFGFCLDAAELLDVDPEFRTMLKQAGRKLPPLMIGQRGQLQEWLLDYEEAQPDHRHLSHLFSLYPGNQVTPGETPELGEAARSTLLTRMSGENLEDVEFTLALLSACFARLWDGVNAFKNLAYLISQLCLDNLFTYSKAGIAGAETNIFVADGNFGGTAAIAEMLLQSHAGAIHLLPAIPESWHTGSVQGLRAKGNAEVEISWKNGHLTGAVIRAFSPVSTFVRYQDSIVPLVLEPGGVYEIGEDFRVTRSNRFT